MRVLENFIVNGEYTVLVCDLFDDAVATDRLSVDGVEFKRDEFIIDRVSHCFGEPMTRNIVVKSINLPKKINSAVFI